MLSITNPTFDLLILQLRLDTICRGLLLLIIFFPRHTRPEYDILAHRRGIEGRPRGVVLLETELRPRAPLGDFWVNGFVDNGCADTPSGFDFFAGVVEGVGNAGFGAVFVGGDLRGGKGGRVV